MKILQFDAMRTNRSVRFSAMFRPALLIGGFLLAGVATAAIVRTVLLSLAGQSTLDCDCSFIRPLVIENDAVIGASTWSPDGKKIAFDKAVVGALREGTMDLPHTREIFMIGSDGQGLQQLTNDNIDDADPTWSRDGKSIVFDSFQSTRKPAEGFLRKLDVATNTLSILFRCQDRCRYPVWSPDGKWVAFQMWQSGKPPNIWLLDMATSEATFLKALPSPSFGMTWSPDGTQLVFVRQGFGTSQLTSLAINDPDREVVLPFAGVVDYPDWSLTTNTIAYVRDDGVKKGMVFLSTVDGLHPAPLFEKPLDSGTYMIWPAFSPDGTQLSFVYSDGIRRQLYLADLNR